MARSTASHTARRLRAALVLGGALLAGALAADLPGTASSAPAPAAPPAANPQAVTPPNEVTKPLWSELTPVQQQALAPLAGEWDKLDSLRKHKWLAIGNKYAKMTPEEQSRLQERMREWVKLTPEQRRIARESYARAKRLNPAQKSAQWQQYQQLPEEQKKKLAADAASKKHVATLPSAATQSAHGKTVPPIKSAPKPVIERSVTPQAVNQSPLQSSSPAPAK